MSPIRWFSIFMICWIVSATAYWGIYKLPILLSDTYSHDEKTSERTSQPELDSQIHLLNVFLNDEDREDARRACFTQQEETTYRKCLALHFRLSYDREPDWKVLEEPQQSPKQLGEVQIATRSQIEIVGDTFIAAIFFSLSLSSALAIFEFVRTICSHQPVARHLHAWIIDAPPILGICGTLFALIVFLAQVNQGQALQLFLPAFSTAAITTLAGGLGAVVNQLLIAFADKH